MVIQLWEENTYLPDALVGEIQVVLLDMFQNQPTKPLELIQMYGFRHQITRCKVRIVYRPKALIEAQRTPALTQSRPGLVQVPLTNGSNTTRSNSPARTLPLNSKVITPTELKELIEILDFGLNESLRAPDIDHPGSDPVWDWTVSSSLSGISQPSIPREHRYSAMPRAVDQSLPIYMRPISLDIGLPPSTSSSLSPKSSFTPLSPSSQTVIPSFAPAPQATTNLPSLPSATHIAAISPASPQTTLNTILNSGKENDTESQQNGTESSQISTEAKPTSTVPQISTSNSIRFEIAVRATSPPRAEARLENATSVRGSGGASAQVFPPPMRSLSPPPPSNSRIDVSSSSSSNINNTNLHLAPSNWVKSQEPSPSPPLSPKESSGSITPSRDTAASPTANPTGQGGTSPRTTSPQPFGTDPSATWISSIAPSETVLEPFVEETTGGSKAMQSLGNAARDRRRRERRPTYDSQHPPEFIGIDKIGSLKMSNSSRDLTSSSGSASAKSTTSPQPPSSYGDPSSTPN